MKSSTARKLRGIRESDIDFGKRIRLRREERKISMSELGTKLGVSFQQIQKYERGINSVGAARLQQIAAALDLPVAAFYDRQGETQEIQSLIFFGSSFSRRLLRAYSKIKDKTTRHVLVSLTESIAAETGRPRGQ
jgi:transcriptional regulator with XRE-family HTH domain